MICLSLLIYLIIFIFLYKILLKKLLLMYLGYNINLYKLSFVSSHFVFLKQTNKWTLRIVVGIRDFKVTNYRLNGIYCFLFFFLSPKRKARKKGVFGVVFDICLRKKELKIVQNRSVMSNSNP